MKIIKLILLLGLMSLLSVPTMAVNDNFVLKDIEGYRWQKSALAGKYIVVNFWASWCSPCLKEISLLVELAEDYPDDVIVLGINTWEDLTQVALDNFIDLYYINYPIIKNKDNQKAVVYFGQLRGLPTTFFYDKTGKQIKKFEGELTQKTFTNLLPDLAKSQN